MKRQVLEIDKMQHLKKLGVDTSNASFYWSYNGRRLNIVSEHGNLKAFEQRNLGIGAFDVQDIIQEINEGIEKYNLEGHLTVFNSTIWFALCLDKNNCQCISDYIEHDLYCFQTSAPNGNNQLDILNQFREGFKEIEKRLMF